MSQATPAWPIYRRLLGHALRYWPLLAVATVGMVVEAVAGGYFIQMMEPLVNRGFVVAHGNPRSRSLGNAVSSIVATCYVLRP